MPSSTLEKNREYQQKYIEKVGLQEVYRKQLIRKMKKGYKPKPATIIKYNIKDEDLLDQE